MREWCFLDSVYSKKRLYSLLVHRLTEEFEHKLIERTSCKVYSELKKIIARFFVFDTNFYHIY